MTIGTTASEILTTLRKNLEVDRTSIEGVFGFGSCFRGEPFDDVDLVLVLRDDCADPLRTYYSVKSAIERLLHPLGVTVDLTVLTRREVGERLLLETDSLTTVA